MRVNTFQECGARTLLALKTASVHWLGISPDSGMPCVPHDDGQTLTCKERL